MTSTLSDQVRTALASAPLDDARVEVQSAPGFKVTATVISPSFEGQDEGARQNIVWRAALDGLGEEGSAKVEFIFTLTPDEARDLGLCA